MKLIAAILLFSVASASHADFSAALRSKAPIELSAAGGIEWDQQRQRYRALGNVRVTKAGLILNAKDIIATHFKNGDIKQLSSRQRFTGKAGAERITATGVQYQPKQQYIRLQGPGLELAMPGQSLKTDGQIEFWQGKNKINITGPATVTKDDVRMVADTITLLLERANNTLQVKQAIAEGNVKLSTKTEQITGKKATYTAVGGQAALTGNVVISRDGNSLKGSNATVNLRTGVSKLINTEGNGRVQGILRLPDNAKDKF